MRRTILLITSIPHLSLTIRVKSDFKKSNRFSTSFRRKYEYSIAIGSNFSISENHIKQIFAKNTRSTLNTQYHAYFYLPTLSTTSSAAYNVNANDFRMMRMISLPMFQLSNVKNSVGNVTVRCFSSLVFTPKSLVNINTDLNF